jgi:hypothetical protein
MGTSMWPDTLAAGSSSQATTVTQKNDRPAVSISQAVPVVPGVERIVSPSASLRSSSGDAALIIGKSGVLTLQSIADKTVLWSSSAIEAHNAGAGADAAADADTTGLFMQVCCSLTVVSS